MAIIKDMDGMDNDFIKVGWVLVLLSKSIEVNMYK